MKRRVYGLISAVLIASMIPFVSFAEEADGLSDEGAAEETSEDEEELTLADYGIAEDEYLVSSQDFYKMVKSIQPWSIIEDTRFSDLTDRQVNRISEAAYPVIKEAVGTDCVLYTWDNIDTCPAPEDAFDITNMVYNPLGIKSSGHPDCKNADNNLVPILSYSESRFAFTGETFMYPGRPSVFPIRLDEDSSLAKLSKVEEPNIISLPDWKFSMRDDEDVFVKCPKFIIDDYWYDTPVTITNVVTRETIDHDNPLYLDFGQYAVLKLTQNVYISEPVSTYMIVVNGTPYTAEYTLYGAKKGEGSTFTLPSDADRVIAEAPVSGVIPAWDIPKPVDPTTTPEYIAMMEQKRKATIIVVSVISGIICIGLVVAFILTGLFNKLRTAIMLRKYADTKAVFHGRLTDKKIWSVKVSPYKVFKKQPDPDTVGEIFGKFSCTEAIAEILDSKIYTFLPASTEMIVYVRQKEAYRSPANEDELYALLEMITAEKAEGVDRATVRFFSEKMGVDFSIEVRF